MVLLLMALVAIEEHGPFALADGFRGVLDERLAQELWAVPAPVDPFLLAAALDHWRHTRVGAEFHCRLVAFAVSAERNHQTRGQLFARPREALEDRSVRMVCEQLADALIREMISGMLCPLHRRMCALILSWNFPSDFGAGQRLIAPERLLL